MRPDPETSDGSAFLLVNFVYGCILAPFPIAASILYKEDLTNVTPQGKLVMESDNGEAVVPPCILLKMCLINFKHPSVLKYIGYNLIPALCPSTGLALFFYMIYVLRLSMFAMMIIGSPPFFLGFYPGTAVYAKWYAGQFSNKQLVIWIQVNDYWSWIVSGVCIIAKVPPSAYFHIGWSSAFYAVVCSCPSRVGHLLSSARHVAGAGCSETVQSLLFATSNAKGPIGSLVSLGFYWAWGMNPRKGIYGKGPNQESNMIQFYVIVLVWQFIFRMPYAFFATISDERSREIRGEVEKEIFEYQMANNIAQPLEKKRRESMGQ